MMRKVIDEAEVAATLAALPTDLPDETIKTVMKRRLLPRDIMLYRVAYRETSEGGRTKKEKIVRGGCSACQNTVDLEYVKNDAGCSRAYSAAPYGFKEVITGEPVVNGINCVCPVCGAGLMARHIAGAEVVAIDERTVVTATTCGGICACFRGRSRKT